MVTNATEEDLAAIAADEHKPSPIPVIRAWAEATTRNVVAGSPVGAVRRILLYMIAEAAIVTMSVGIDAWWALVPGVLGSAAIGFLMATDDNR